VEAVDSPAEAAERGTLATLTDEALACTVGIASASGTKCERCWHFSDDIDFDGMYPKTCERCSTALKQMDFPAVTKWFNLDPPAEEAAATPAPAPSAAAPAAPAPAAPAASSVKMTAEADDGAAEGRAARRSYGCQSLAQRARQKGKALQLPR
jgi:hypothetical protein